MSPRSAGARVFLLAAGGGLLVQALTLASGPLLARMLGPEGRGEFALAMTLTVLCGLVGLLGLPVAIAHAVAGARARTASASARDLLRPMLFRWFAWAVVPATVAAALTGWLVAPGLLVVGAFLVTVLSVWRGLLLGMLQGEGEVRHVNALRLVGTAVYVGFVVALFVLAPTTNPAWVLLAFALALLIGVVDGWRRLEPTGRMTPEPVDAAGVHGFARRSFVSSTSLLDSLGLDVLTVGLVAGPVALGYYAVALSFTNLPGIVLAGVAAMLLPRLAAQPAADAARTARRWVAGSALVAVVIVVGLQLVLGPVVRLAFGSEFVPATTTARILAVAWGFLALRRVLTAAVQAQGRSSAASAVESVCAVLLVAGVAVGARQDGTEGAALALVGVAALACVALGLLIRWTSDTTSTTPDPVPVPASAGPVAQGGTP